VNIAGFEGLIIIVHLLAAIGIVALVLLQQGKGADAGASFGGGASQTLFGSVGSGNVLSHTTAWLAVVFFVTSIGLAFIAKQRVSSPDQNSGLIENIEQMDSLAPPLDSDLPDLSENPVNEDEQPDDIPVLGAEPLQESAELPD
jgi:preprotein translocase subunit SecG